MVSAMRFAVPLAFLTAFVSFSISASDAFMMASRPDIPFWPASIAAYCAFSASFSVSNCALVYRMISDKSFMDPSAFWISMSRKSIAVADSFVGFAIRVSHPRSAVPAWLPLIPAFAMRPVATAMSSMLNPSAPATGAAYLNVSPIMDTFVFAFVDAAARTSAKCAESFAVRLKAESESVTMSEVVARSRPSAADRDMIPEMPSSISSVFHPAMAMYWKASAASEALNLVSAPISLAFARRSSKSFPVAPEIAATLLMELSKSAVVFTAATPTAAAAALIGISASPTALIFCPAASMSAPICWRSLGMFFSSVSRRFSSAVASFTACFHFSVSWEFSPYFSADFSSIFSNSARRSFCVWICLLRISRCCEFFFCCAVSLSQAEDMAFISDCKVFCC